MTSPALLVPTRLPPADHARCHDFVLFLQRRGALDGEEVPRGGQVDPAAATASLLRLSDLGLLSYAPASSNPDVEVFYTPSREASENVFNSGPDAGFPEPVWKKQKDAFRTSPGALFLFPWETGGGALPVFITDWSPCPAACAVAVHRSHPCAADLEKPPGASFTGRYVRHPLTGDLLPVWVADWVRPDFGTGAVLVNPAHDATDLAFGRAVGLPIRFALAPTGYDGSPATWPDPPLVKTGQAVRTGLHDGLPAAEAAALYFETLAARGLATSHLDLHAGRFLIGRLVPDPEGHLAWSASRWRLLPSGGAPAGASSVGLAEADLLEVAVTATASRPLLVCPSSAQAGNLLALRLLAYDLAGRELVPAAVFLVHKVQETKVEASADVLRLAALLGSPIQQVAVLKQQVVEQVQRFLRVHHELLALAADLGTAGAPEEASWRALSKVKAAVCETDPAKAFSLLLQVQKQVLNLSPPGRAATLSGYFVLTGVLAGLPVPEVLEAAPVWRQIGVCP